jgi:SAM-dependent methyltransferase
MKRELEYFRSNRDRFKDIISLSKVRLEGRVLDLCSGDVSVASIYSPKNVVCYDISFDFLNCLGRKNISGVRGDVSSTYLPFQDNVFNYTFCAGTPMKLPCDSQYSTPEARLFFRKNYVENLINEIIRVSSDKAILHSVPLLRLFPEKYNDRVNLRDNESSIAVLDCVD